MAVLWVVELQDFWWLQVLFRLLSEPFCRAISWSRRIRSQGWTRAQPLPIHLLLFRSPVRRPTAASKGSTALWPRDR
uniref:Secreted protein n=1 Tax=Arundo donax TaxID=35708 RepID=A0A0A9DS71_ARUDO